MNVEERCLCKLVKGSVPSNNFSANGCYQCLYDPKNNRSCPYYSPMKIVVVEVSEKPAESEQRGIQSLAS